jgi:hypothetical protein
MHVAISSTNQYSKGREEEQVEVNLGELVDLGVFLYRCTIEVVFNAHLDHRLLLLIHITHRQMRSLNRKRSEWKLTLPNCELSSVNTCVGGAALLGGITVDDGDAIVNVINFGTATLKSKSAIGIAPELLNVDVTVTILGVDGFTL